jgi:signal transduction histidine kinase
VITAHDITRRKEAEETLRLQAAALNAAANELAIARDQALEASRFKSELLARVSHELRTPLGAIIGYAELLHSGLYGELMGAQQKVVLEVVDSAKHLTQMVNELLEEAQLNARAVKLHPGPFSPKEMLQAIETRMIVLAQNKGLSFSATLSPEVPPSLIGDPARLQQILINLIGNAIKFSETGSVEVRIYAPDPAHWAMEVKDTGTGIPVEAQTYIFEPFHQLDGTMTREYGGTGLGLSITKQLTELMGGQLLLESEPGKGSTFTVLLPIQTAQEMLP